MTSVDLEKGEWHLIIESLKTTKVVSETSELLKEAPILRGIMEGQLEKLINKIERNIP